MIRKQKIIKRIIFASLLQKVKFEEKITLISLYIIIYEQFFLIFLT